MQLWGLLFSQAAWQPVQNKTAGSPGSDHSAIVLSGNIDPVDELRSRIFNAGSKGDRLLSADLEDW